MEFVCKTRALSSLVKEVAKGKYSFKHKLQRREGQWSKLQQSELIDSILRSYPIDAIRCEVKDNINYIFDGVQRLSNISLYINDAFRLSKKLKPVFVDENEYEIANKKFSELDEVLQDKVKNYEVQVFLFYNCTDADIREMFRRQNNGKPLSNTQKRTALESDELGQEIFSLILNPFFDKILTKAQVKKDVDKEIVREVLMLISGYEFNSFRSKDIDGFVEWYNENFNPDDISVVLQALNELNVHFEENHTVNKLTASMLIYGMAKVIKEGRSTEAYLTWLKEFLSSDDLQAEFGKYCGAGTTTAEKVKGRKEFFENAIEKLNS